ncbi:unnamed protein product, partial [marine sediment metagenome]
IFHGDKMTEIRRSTNEDGHYDPLRHEQIYDSKSTYKILTQTLAPDGKHYYAGAAGGGIRGAMNFIPLEGKVAVTPWIPFSAQISLVLGTKAAEPITPVNERENHYVEFMILHTDVTPVTNVNPIFIVMEFHDDSTFASNPIVNVHHTYVYDAVTPVHYGLGNLRHSFTPGALWGKLPTQGEHLEVTIVSGVAGEVVHITGLYRYTKDLQRGGK